MKAAPAGSNVAAEQNAVLDTARAVLEIEAQAVSGLIRRLDAHFVRAVELIMSRRGRSGNVSQTESHGHTYSYSEA